LRSLQPASSHLVCNHYDFRNGTGTFRYGREGFFLHAFAAPIPIGKEQGGAHTSKPPSIAFTTSTYDFGRRRELKPVAARAPSVHQISHVVNAMRGPPVIHSINGYCASSSTSTPRPFATGSDNRCRTSLKTMTEAARPST
jgi:hypothetical protein